MAAHGVTPQTLVVAYDASGGMYAAHLWWMLRWLGHERVAVLDGGWQAWTAAGLPVSTEPGWRRGRASPSSRARRWPRRWMPPRCWPISPSPPLP